jgi:hypothetical protein
VFRSSASGLACRYSDQGRHRNGCRAPSWRRSEPAKAAPQPLDNYKRAMAIWSESRDPRATLVEVYLRSRRLELPGEAAGEAIRFNPACPFGPERFPAMICLVRNVVAASIYLLSIAAPADTRARFLELGYYQAFQQYSGRAMRESHEQLRITEAEWGAFCKDFDDTMAKFGVPDAEKNDSLRSCKARRVTSL